MATTTKEYAMYQRNFDVYSGTYFLIGTVLVMWIVYPGNAAYVLSYLY